MFLLMGMRSRLRNEGNPMSAECVKRWSFLPSGQHRHSNTLRALQLRR